ncbi:MAG: hypothetical protein AAFY63_18435 [Cyanobacteria bacterium J06643_13]
MKKILPLSIITLTILCQNMAIARASEAEMPNDEFTRLVCRYLSKTDDKTEALDQIRAKTEFKINDSQLAKLEEIAKSEETTKNFCSSFSIRL